jgi:hypothetical protein
LSNSGSSIESFYVTVNYLFASYLQTSEAGSHRISRVEKIKPGKAKFFFSITEAQATELKFKFHESVCSEFERCRRHTIDLSYMLLFGLFTHLVYAGHLWRAV